MEFINPATGLRLDGRKVNEIRRIQCKIGVLSRADGSAFYQQGNTRVIAAVYGPREVTQKSKVLHDRAIINCEFSMAPFSTGERRKKTKGDRRSTEISLLIRQSFDAVILTHLFPRSQIDIYIQVLQADGGNLSACINAATLALINAGVPMQDFIVSCNAGCIDGTPLLDLNYLEDSAEGPDLPVAFLPQSGKITMLQMDSRISLDLFEKVVEMAIYGCKLIYEIMKKEVEKYSQDLKRFQNI